MTRLMIAAIVAFLVFLGVDYCQSVTAPPIVKTKYGLIEGTTDGFSRGGRYFFQFKGIQYAVVEERFKPSVEPKPWKGIKLANESGPACWNVNKHMKENCLYLNVYTPSLERNTDSLLPVAVYVHGGSFQGGKGDNYGPNYLIDENIILVTINYRLGILGFLSTENEDSPGNYGLKDQVMALKWVQENIHAFGGNKSQVTLFGQSAGSASVTYHLVSPMSRGLFQHAIAQSGSFLDPWAHTIKPLRYARKLAKHLNCDTSNTTVMVECLRKCSLSSIGSRNLAGKLTVKFFEDPIAGFGPTVEPASTDSFLSTSPYDLLVAGKVNKVPLMAGLVQEEGIYLWAAFVFFSNDDDAILARKNLGSQFTSVAPAAFYFDEKSPSNRHTEIARKVQNFYFGKSGFALGKNESFFQLSHVYSDRLFVASVVRFMNLYSKLSPTYPYLYTFNKFVGAEFGSYDNMTELHKEYHLNATHAAELDMIFSPLFNETGNPVHNETSERITKLWASFMRTGVPSATYGSERNFPPIQGDIGLQNFYRLDIDTELRKNEFAERIAFWESLGLSDNDFKNCNC